MGFFICDSVRTSPKTCVCEPCFSHWICLDHLSHLKSSMALAFGTSFVGRFRRPKTSRNRCGLTSFSSCRPTTWAKGCSTSRGRITSTTFR
jgi:hypothetical protein